MWTGTRPTTPPLVCLEQILSQLNVAFESADDDQLLTDYIDAASEYAESALDSSLLTRTITATFFDDDHGNEWEGGCHRHHRLFLPRGPVQSITSITDANAVNITAFQLQRFGNSDCVRIHQKYTRPLTVVYVAGYGSDPTDVPADIRMAIRTHAAQMYRIREPVRDEKLYTVPLSLEAFYARKCRTAPAA